LSDSLHAHQQKRPNRNPAEGVPNKEAETQVDVVDHRDLTQRARVA